jgi:immune inhibitor A
LWRNRVQTYDSTFSLQPTDAFMLHVGGFESPVAAQPGVPVFDDRITYYDPANPQGSVKNPNTGTKIWIQGVGAQESLMQILVAPAK